MVGAAGKNIVSVFLSAPSSRRWSLADGARCDAWSSCGPALAFSPLPSTSSTSSSAAVFSFSSSSILPPVCIVLSVSLIFPLSHTGRLGHNALHFLRLWSTGLRGYRRWGGVRAVGLQKGQTNPRLRAFLKSTCFVLLHTGTPWAPLAKFALCRTLTHTLHGLIDRS